MIEAALEVSLQRLSLCAARAATHRSRHFNRVSAVKRGGNQLEDHDQHNASRHDHREERGDQFEAQAAHGMTSSKRYPTPRTVATKRGLSASSPSLRRKCET